jgi:diguanylate cyclase (GGDEF)-like protein
LSVFSSFIGFFDSLTWFIFFLYTTLGLVLLDWRYVIATDSMIILWMILFTIFHDVFPYPVQAYLFLSSSDINSMSFLDLLSAWSICASVAFAGMWIMTFLLRNWHVQCIEHVSSAHFDPLTRVLKRRDVLDALENEVLLAAREKTPLTVAVIDLDAFKPLNEKYGHVFGDKTLFHIASKLKEVTRAQDLVGRYGGQEFIVVFPGCTVELAEQVLERLKARLVSEGVTNKEGDVVKMMFSAGIAHLRAGDQKYENIIARADRALGQAKASGGNRIIVDNS